MAEAPDTRICSQCGAQSPAGQRFCGSCGANLVSSPPIAIVSVPEVETTSGTDTIASSPLIPTSVAKEDRKSPVVSGSNTNAIPNARERDRLLTLANVQRMRGQLGEARKTIDTVLTLSEGLSEKDLAPIYELRGDLLQTEGRWEEAQAAFDRAHTLDPAPCWRGTQVRGSHPARCRSQSHGIRVTTRTRRKLWRRGLWRKPGET